MTDAWRVASITEFHEVPVGDAISLLRVTAESNLAADPGDERPLLIVDEGDTASAFAALPAPADEDGRLRCAYSVPVAALGVDNTFSLEFEDGLVLALPFPSASTPHVPPPPPVSPQVLELVLDAAEARAELSAMQDLQALGAGRQLAAAPAGSASAFTDGGDSAARAAELEIWSSELERRLADTTTELQQAQAELARLRPGAGGAGGLGDADREQITSAALHDAGRRAERDLADAGG